MKILVDRELIEKAATFLSYANLYDGTLSDRDRVTLIDTTQELEELLIDNFIPMTWAIIEIEPIVKRGQGKYISSIEHKVVGVFNSRDEAENYIKLNDKNLSLCWIVEVK